MKKKVIWLVVSILLAVVTIHTIDKLNKGFSLDGIVGFLRDSNKLWVVMALICMFGFIFFEGMAIDTAARGLGYPGSRDRGTLYGAADVFFSAITPSASGGQPASAYFMVLHGISIPAATAILLINLVMYTLSLLIVGGLNMLLHFDLFLALSLPSRILVVIGIVIMSILCMVFYIALRKSVILKKIGGWLIHMITKLHLVRHPEKLSDRLEKVISEFQECSDVIAGHARMLRQVFALNLLQRISQLGVTFMIFMALGKSLDIAEDAFAIHSFVALGSNSIPIPGGMGGADYIMIDGFGILVGAADAANIEMLCRGFAFYICVVTSAFIVTVGYLLSRKRAN